MNKYQERLLNFGSCDSIDRIKRENTYCYLVKKLTDEEIGRIKRTSFFQGIGDNISELKDIKERLQISWDEMRTLIRKIK